VITERREGSSSALLVVDAVVKAFGGVRAVDGATLTVSPGSITGLIGPNGAGKSSLVGLLSGAIPVDEGTINFAGRDITGLPAYQVAREGLVRTFQLSSEFGQLTVLENLMVAAPNQAGEGFRVLWRRRRAWRAEQDALVLRARELLDRFGMLGKADDLAGTLSGGQKRIVEIMRALMAQPKLLLLDEPMAGINPSLGRTIEGYLRDVNREEKLTMLIVEHELGALERMCTSAVVMAQGRVIADGSLTEVLRRREVIDAYIVG
jgi:ABC-type branched-subunit amino acid transport system ATPase component